jgi:hypothetical protein
MSKRTLGIVLTATFAALLFLPVAANAQSSQTRMPAQTGIPTSSCPTRLQAR